MINFVRTLTYYQTTNWNL